MISKSRSYQLPSSAKTKIVSNLIVILLVENFVNSFAIDRDFKLYVFPFFALKIFAQFSSKFCTYLLSLITFGLYFSTFFIPFSRLFFLVILINFVSQFIKKHRVLPFVAYCIFFGVCILFDHTVSTIFFIKSSIISSLILLTVPLRCQYKDF